MSDLDIEEDLAHKRLDRQVLTRCLGLLTPVWPRCALVVVIETVIVISIFYRPWFLGRLIDQVTIGA